jgi:hypothetical protein
MLLAGETNNQILPLVSKTATSTKMQNFNRNKHHLLPTTNIDTIKLGFGHFPLTSIPL